MLSHESVWSAIDRLARHNGMTPSGLARRAGLDPTTFNPSKRIAADGRPRWPSMESISKILDATKADLAEFVALMRHPEASSMTPMPPTAMAGFFSDASAASSESWPDHDDLEAAERVVALPDHDLTLKVHGRDLMPLYRDGDVLVVSPAADIRPGDRVLVRHAGGRLSAHVLLRRTRTRVEFAGARESDPPLRHGITEIAWIARVIWASQ
uniref:S24 family peptidase n=1 Tax=Stappia sp. TaxID=1870903 RepID=UPI003BAB737D